MPISLRTAGAAALLAVSQLANAAFLVDTGPGTIDPRSSDGNYGLYSQQWLAERFSLDSAAVISSVTGWVAADSRGGTAHVSILADNGEAGPGEVLFTSQFSVYGYSVGFAGVDDISLALSAGTYFIAFQVLEGDTLSGSMPSQSEAPLSLGSYGYYSMAPFEPRWYHSIDTRLGIQIEGVSAVPEPGSGALMLGGMAVLAAWAARRRKHD